MNFNEYQELSKRTMPKPLGIIGYLEPSIANYTIGLVAEAGEVADIIKKELFHGHKRDVEAIKKELGDTLHYLSGIATMHGLTLEEVAIANIEKLKARYPDGFSTEASVKRVDVND